MSTRSVVIAIVIISLFIISPAVHTEAFQETPEPEPAESTEQIDQPQTVQQVNATNSVYLPLASVNFDTAAPPPPPSGPTIINHSSVALFERIPDRYLTAARNLRVLFSDRSVGVQFNESLNCLSASTFGSSPSFCRVHYTSGFSAIRTYSQADYDAGQVPAVIRFAPNPTRYNRSNWAFETRSGSWSELTGDFINSMAPSHIQREVLSYQFSYLNVTDGSDIMRFWDNNPNLYDIYDLEAFWRRYPNKTFVLWTASLARSIGTDEAHEFNTRMRQYAIAHNMYLFDFAAIESYTHSGQPCYDNRDGVPFANPANPAMNENYPNDGRSIPAICQDYTTEPDGGHLGSVSGARIRTAKAFWVLMARIAGWDGVSQ